MYGGRGRELVHYDRVLQPRNYAGQIYRVCQWASETTVSQAAVSPSFAAFNFQLSTMPQHATFSSLFDQYRITRVSIQFRPMFTAMPLQPSLTVSVPLIYTVVDYDDSSTPTAIADLREYQNCNVHEYESFTHEFTPHIAMAAYSSGGFTSYANQTMQWLDIASPSVQHYGLKLGITAGFSGQILQIWNVSMRLEFEFRNIR